MNSSSLTVYHIAGAWGIPSISPFCLKLETYLQITQREHQVVLDASPWKGPKGKLPWVEHNGLAIGDSGFVIEHLKRHFSENIDAHLNTQQLALSHALRRLLEENLYWVMVYDRWLVDANWAEFKHIVFADVPALLKPIIAPMARKGVLKSLLGHGLAKHSREEIYDIGVQDVNAISAVLADQPFVMGQQVSEIDCIAYATLSNILQSPFDNPVKQAGLATANLLNYCQRMHSRYFADAVVDADNLVMA